MSQNKLQWQPPMPKIIAQRLQERYSQVDSKLIEEVAIVKSLLLDIEYGKEILIGLQKNLGEKLLCPDFLDAFLTKVELELGFEKRTPVDHGLTVEEFQKLLDSKQHMLDAGANADHGPHTHRLQWYILYTAFEQKKFETKPAELFKKLASKEFIDTLNQNRTIWDDIFDYDDPAGMIIGVQEQGPEARPYARFSSPEFLLAYLVSPSFPKGVLQKELRLIQLRQKKLGKLSILNIKDELCEAIISSMKSKELISMMSMEEEPKDNVGQEKLEEGFKSNIKWEKLKEELSKKTLQELDQEYAQYDKIFQKELEEILN
ncbi:MAG TPA: LirA/MavJ family T4SS effector [Ktedonosporobacter sp.]|jgi:hypothetical protein|nr:LirA/MavJ family T4SS effector [Ktedonosporobacter sp.]